MWQHTDSVNLSEGEVSGRKQKIIWYWDQFYSRFMYRFSAFVFSWLRAVVSCLIMIQLSSSLSETANLPMDIRKKIKQEKTIGALTIFKVGFLKILDYWSLPSCTFIFLWFHFSPRYYFWHYFLLIVTALGCHTALSCESWHFEMVPLSRGVTHFFFYFKRSWPGY